MELYIHAGFHKTATTSFQKLCSDHDAELRALGLCYPRYDHPSQNPAFRQHSFALWDEQAQGPAVLDQFLVAARAEAEGCRAVLVSGEDFENAIVDLDLARRVEAAARAAGFDAVTWFIALRDKESYLDSTYFELSKHGALTTYATLAKAADARGCFYVSTEKVNNIFVFDYPRFAAAFEAATQGAVATAPFAAFVDPFPGAPLLRLALGEDGFAAFAERRRDTPAALNRADAPADIEFRYALTFLTYRRFLHLAPVRALYRLALQPIIRLRLSRIRRVKAARRNAARG